MQDKLLRNSSFMTSELRVADLPLLESDLWRIEMMIYVPTN